ncbi:Threonyl-tRNA synthetase [Hordeum vulgare]|nr:Threonyl-tRNA synthetase [Hordeum vulgare]
MNPSGYDESDLIDDDKFIVFLYKMIAQGLFQERNNKGEKRKKKGRAFTFHHCFKEIKDEEKWKTTEVFDDSIKKSVVLEDEEDVRAHEISSPTPHSATIGPMELRK